MFLVSVLTLEVANQLLGFVFGPLSESRFFFFFDLLIKEELIVKVEVAARDDLEERLSVKIDFIVVVIGLVVDVGVSKAVS